ncbi:unnamed protein product [Camellia sinensis]
MYSSNPTADQKHVASPPKESSAASMPYGEPASGIPVSYTNQQPPVQPLRSKPKVPWSTGLCDCFDDVPNCCITCWCPCITFGQIAEIVDKGSTSCGASGALYTLIACVTGCPCCYSCFYRAKMRQQYVLHETPCCDCLVHCCCESCALCQEYRELKNRGFDMSVGWHGNAERQYREMEMAPVSEQGMSR